MKKHEITDGTWVYSTYHKQANLVKTVDGDLVTFRYPFKSTDGGEIYHTSLSFMAKDKNYRRPILNEMEYFNKQLGLNTVLSQGNQFKEGDFIYDYSLNEVNQIKTISTVLSGANIASFYYAFSNNMKTYMLAYITDTMHCRPATASEITSFVASKNAELQAPVFSYCEGDWVIINTQNSAVDVFLDANKILSIPNDDDECIRVKYVIRLDNTHWLHNTGTIRVPKSMVIRLATQKEVITKIKWLCDNTPNEVVQKF